MAEFRRPHHRVIAQILKSLNAELLAQADCYFGGGTHLSMSFGEYRESRDLGFLCSSRAGFRLVRQEVDERSLGRLVARTLPLARDVRAATLPGSVPERPASRQAVHRGVGHRRHHLAAQRNSAAARADLVA